MQKALLVGIALVLVVPTVVAKVDAPPRALGDFWEMDAQASTPQGGDVWQTMRAEIVAFETLTLDSVAHEAAVQETRHEQRSGSGGFEVTATTQTRTWMRASDGALLRTISTTRTSANFAGHEGGETTTETTYLRPCRHLAFPFDVGDSWTSACRTRTVTNSTHAGRSGASEGEETTSVRVLRAERVEVPAGAFDAVVLEWTSGGGDNATRVHHWYAPAACGPVRTALDAEGKDITGVLRAYRCGDAGAPPATATPASPGPAPSGPAEASDVPALGLVALLATAAVAAAARRRG